MKWTFEPGEPSPVLALRLEEVKCLVEILARQARGNVRRKYEKYKDIHESGEGTDRQCDLMLKYEEQLKLIDNLILYSKQ